MLIGDLAKKSGFSRDTIRFYQKRGLIKGEPDKSAGNNYRRYDNSTVDRLRLIKLAKTLGFTLREISGLIDDWEGGRLSNKQKARIFREKIELVEKKIKELEKVKDYLEKKLRMFE